MVTLEMGGAPREIRFDFDAVEAAEAAIGQPFRGLILQQRGLTIDQIVRILWAVWSRQDKTLTLGKVRAWVKQFATAGGTLLQAETAILDAAIESELVLPKADAITEDADRPPMGSPRDGSPS